MWIIQGVISLYIEFEVVRIPVYSGVKLVRLHYMMCANIGCISLGERSKPPIGAFHVDDF